MKPYSLGKHERLKGKKNIDTLFQQGEAFFLFPFKILFTKENNSALPMQANMGVSIPKRLFKKAVHRNYLKRITREHYRKSKQTLFVNNPHTFYKILFLYTHHVMCTYAEVQKPIEEILKRIAEK